MGMEYTLDFEKPVFELENQIKELKQASNKPNIDITREIKALQKKVDVLIKDIYGNLTSWERVQLARHPKRPHAIDYIQNCFEDFHEIHGDRKFADDKSLIAGFGYVGKQKVAILGIEKGRNTKEKVQRNFGMPRPEGYRKALRLMELASQFNIPIVTLVDTPGAYPGVGAEERGQSQAIAENIAKAFDVKAPILSFVIGEGGSGGALGIAIADKVFMFEYSIYSVISPESCASILWADPKKAEQAANSLQLGPHKAKELKIIDKVISEPAGGAHRHPEEMYQTFSKLLSTELEKVSASKPETLMKKRFEKFRQIGNTTLLQKEISKGSSE